MCVCIKKNNMFLTHKNVFVLWTYAYRTEMGARNVTVGGMNFEVRFMIWCHTWDEKKKKKKSDRAPHASDNDIDSHNVMCVDDWYDNVTISRTSLTNKCNATLTHTRAGQKMFAVPLQMRKWVLIFVWIYEITVSSRVRLKFDFQNADRTDGKRGIFSSVVRRTGKNAFETDRDGARRMVKATFKKK